MTRWIRLSVQERGALPPRTVRWHQERADRDGMALCGIELTVAERVESDEAPKGFPACGLCRKAAERNRVYVEHFKPRRETVYE